MNYLAYEPWDAAKLKYSSPVWCELITTFFYVQDTDRGNEAVFHVSRYRDISAPEVFLPLFFENEYFVRNVEQHSVLHDVSAVWTCADAGLLNSFSSDTGKRTEDKNYKDS